jgi:hypothetical protein
MGVPMNSNNTQTARRRIIFWDSETPSPRRENAANAETQQAPKWKNLTLDELQAWMDEEGRREEERNKTTHPR